MSSEERAHSSHLPHAARYLEVVEDALDETSRAGKVLCAKDRRYGLDMESTLLVQVSGGRLETERKWENENRSYNRIRVIMHNSMLTAYVCANSTVITHDSLQ